MLKSAFLVAVILIVVAGLTWWLLLNRENDRLLEAIDSKPGWHLVFHPGTNEPRKLSLLNAPISTSYWKEVAKMSTLVEMGLLRSGLAGVELQEVELERLERLDLSENPVTDSALPVIASNFKNLETLRLHRTLVTSAGLPALRKLSRLRVLNISGTDVTDLSPLREMDSLEDLDASRTRVETLSGIEELPLRKLYLEFTRVTDDVVKNLARMPRLETVSLSGTRLTDTGFEKLLSSLVGLRYLVVEDTAVTEAAAELARSKHSSVTVYR